MPYVMYRFAGSYFTFFVFLTMTLYGQAQVTLYWGGGTSDITPPQTPASVDGTWNASLKNWAVDAAGNAYTNWQAGAFADFGSSSADVVVTLEDDLEINGMTWTKSANGNLTIQSSATRTLSLTGPSPTINVIGTGGGNILFKEIRFGANVLLDGAAEFTKTGPSTLYFIEDTTHPVTATVTVAEGWIRIDKGRLPNVDEFCLINAGLRLDNPAVGNQDRIADNAVIRLIDGTLDCSLSADRSETIGTLDIADSIGTLYNIINGNTNTALIMNQLNRGNRGALYFASDLSSYNGKVTVNSGIPAGAMDVSLSWAVYSPVGAASRFVRYSSANATFEPTVDVAAPQDASTWDSQSYDETTDLYYTWGPNDGYPSPLTGALDNDLVLRTFASGPSSTSEGDNTLDLGGHTLTLRAMSMSSTGGSSTQFTVQNGTISSPTNQLFLFAARWAYFQARLHGVMDVVVCSREGFRFGSITTDNTYTGIMHIVGDGQVTAAGSGRLTTGDLFLGPQAKLQTADGGTLAPTGVVYLSEGAIWSYLNGDTASETVGGLAGHGTVDLAWGNNTRNLVVDMDADGAFDGTITGTSNASDSRVEKAGDGVWTLNGTNDYNHQTLVSGGVLLVNGSHANATSGRGYTVQNGAALGGSGAISLANANMIVESGGRLTPGNGGTGTLNLDLGGGALNLSAMSTNAMCFDLGSVTTSDKILLSNGLLNIGDSVFDIGQFAFSIVSGFGGPATYTLIETDQSITTSLGADVTAKLSNNYTLTLRLADSDTDLVLDVIPPKGSVFTIF